MKSYIKRTVLGILLFLVFFVIANTIISFCTVKGPLILSDLLAAPWGTCWFAMILIGILIFLLIRKNDSITPISLFLSLGIIVILTILFFLWEYTGWDPDINSIWWRYDKELQELLLQLHLIPQTNDADLLSAYAWAYSWNYHLSSYTILHIGFAYLGYASCQLIRYFKLRRNASGKELSPATKRGLTIVSCVLGVLLVIGITSYVIIEVNRPVSTGSSATDIVYEGGGATLTPGGNSWGFYDSSGAILADASTVTPEDGQFRATLSFQQDYDSTVHYGLLVLKDNRQIAFQVAGNDTRLYRFELTGEDETDIPFCVDVSDHCYEVAVLIITEPDVTSEILPGGSTNDLMVQSILQNIYIERYYMEDGISPHYNEVSLTPAKGEKNNGIAVVTNDKYMKELSIVKSGSIMRALYADRYIDDCNVTLVAFCDWEQVPLTDGAETITFHYDKKHPGYYEIQLPQDKAESCYQVIALEEPHDFSNISNASYRIFLE